MGVSYFGANDLDKLIRLIKGMNDKNVPNTRKVNGKALSSDISLGASDVGAIPISKQAEYDAKQNDVGLSVVDGCVCVTYEES